MNVISDISVVEDATSGLFAVRREQASRMEDMVREEDLSKPPEQYLHGSDKLQQQRHSRHFLRTQGFGCWRRAAWPQQGTEPVTAANDAPELRLLASCALAHGKRLRPSSDAYLPSRSLRLAR